MRGTVSAGTSVAVAVAIITLALIAPAQFASARNSVLQEYAALAAAPESARVLRNPMAGDLRAAAAGRKLFAQHCAQCHGKNGEGTNRAPSLLEDEVQNATPGALFWVLTNGVVRRGMPVWSKLPEPQRWQIVTYIRTLEAAPPPPKSGESTAP